MGILDMPLVFEKNNGLCSATYRMLGLPTFKNTRTGLQIKKNSFLKQAQI